MMQTVSLKKSLPVGYDPTQGIRNLRVRDNPPISVKSLTWLVSATLPFSGPVSLNAGHVYASQLRVHVWGNGQWWFSGHLDDTSVVFGDNYGVGFSFEDGDLAGVKTGELGADATSVPQHINFAIEGRSEYLQRNYFQVLQGGLKFGLHQSDDLGQVFDDIGEDLKWLGRQLEVMFSYDSTAQTVPPDYPPPDPYPPPGGGGGEED